MKIIFFTLSALVYSGLAQGQYLWYQTKITCKTENKEVIDQGKMALDAALKNMVESKKLYEFDVARSTNEKETTLTYLILAEDEGKFHAIHEQWMKQVKVPALKKFWEGCPTMKDTLSNSTRLYFPLIKNINSPVAEVPIIEEKPDISHDYKIIIDFTSISELKGKKNKMDSSSVNWGLDEVGRIINLHIAAGVPKEKLNVVLAVHGFAVRSFFNNDEYKKRYNTDNPNISIIKELENAGVKFIQCGQNAAWFGVKKEMLLPQMKMALSAKTTITSYQMKGYALMKIAND